MIQLRMLRWIYLYLCLTELPHACGNPLSVILNEINIVNIESVELKEFVEIKSFAPAGSKVNLQGYYIGKSVIFITQTVFLFNFCHFSY